MVDANTKAQILKELEAGIINQEEDKILALTRKSLDAGIEPLEVIEQGLAKGLKHVGELFAKGELYVVQLIYVAEIMKGAMAILEPAIAKGKAKRTAMAQYVIGTVQGDIHDIGKNIVKIMVEIAGFEVEDLGKDVPSEKFIEAAKRRKAQLVGASSLMTTTMGAQKGIADELARGGGGAKLMVGGAAVSDAWAREIGATYAADATSAVTKAKELLGIRD